jgi:hypothetical protein
VERSRRPPAAVETAQLARPKPPPGSRPKSQLKPRGKVYTGGEVEELSRELSAGVEQNESEASVPATVPAPAPAQAPAPAAAPAAGRPLSREASAVKKSGGWFGSRKPKTPGTPEIASPPGTAYSLVPEGGAAPTPKAKWEPPPAAAGAAVPLPFRLGTEGGSRQSQQQRTSGVSPRSALAFGPHSKFAAPRLPSAMPSKPPRAALRSCPAQPTSRSVFCSPLLATFSRATPDRHGYCPSHQLHRPIPSPSPCAPASPACQFKLCLPPFPRPHDPKKVPNGRPPAFLNPPPPYPSPSGLPEGTRAAPPPPDYIATMRMEDMLRAAAEAAAAAAASAPMGDTAGGPPCAGDTIGGAEAEQFRLALARYQKHPGIQRKQAEGERAARARREVRRMAGGGGGRYGEGG